MKAAVAVFASLLAGHALAIDYPPNPVAPESVVDCNTLSAQYLQLSGQLQQRHEALGRGRGRQVLAGPCCMKAPGSTSGWCKTYESHATAWDAIHCVAIEKERAEKQCIQDVRKAKERAQANKKSKGETSAKADTKGKMVAKSKTESQSKPGSSPPKPSRASEEVRKFVQGGKLADIRGFQMASDLLRYKSWYEVAAAWKTAGNSPANLKGAVKGTTDVAAREGIRNPFIREFVAMNLVTIDVTNDNLEARFDSQMEDLRAEFPNTKFQSASESPREKPAQSPPVKTAYGKCLEEKGSDKFCCMADGWEADEDGKCWPPGERPGSAR